MLSDTTEHMHITDCQAHTPTYDVQNIKRTRNNFTRLTIKHTKAKVEFAGLGFSG